MGALLAWSVKERVISLTGPGGAARLCVRPRQNRERETPTENHMTIFVPPPFYCHRAFARERLRHRSRAYLPDL